MSNFDFIRAYWPDIAADCARAESYLASDPRSACFYARRAAEQDQCSPTSATRPVPTRAATDALRELLHIMVWAAVRPGPGPGRGAPDPF